MDTKPPNTDHAQVLTLPPLIPSAATGSGWLLDRYALPWPVIEKADVITHTALTSAALALAGLAMVIFAASLWPFWKTRQNPEPHTPTNALYTDGIYRFSRNPIYLGFVISQLAVGLYWNNAWVLLLTPVTIGILQWGIIKPEEAYLQRLFGDAYRHYRKKVRRWL